MLWDSLIRTPIWKNGSTITIHYLLINLCFLQYDVHFWLSSLYIIHVDSYSLESLDLHRIEVSKDISNNDWRTITESEGILHYLLPFISLPSGISSCQYEYSISSGSFHCNSSDHGWIRWLYEILLIDVLAKHTYREIRSVYRMYPQYEIE